MQTRACHPLGVQERIVMKRLIISILIISIMISAIIIARKSSSAQTTTPYLINAATTSVTVTQCDSIEQSETPKVEIISDHVQDISFSGSAKENESAEYEYYMTYAEYVPSGIQMVDSRSEYSSGKLIYTITDVYIIDNINDRGACVGGLSIDTKMHWSEENGWQELDKPDWLNNDGSFDPNVSILMVDITVYNDGAERSSDTDRYGNIIDPYTFNADGLIWLSDMQSPSGKRNYSYTAINYFSLLGTDPNYAYDYQVAPGDTISFTVGFVLGSDFTYQSDSVVFLTNTCGNQNGIYIKLNFGKD